MKYKPWTRALANRFLRKLEKEISDNWHVALAGSVLTKGRSDKDLDVVVFAHTIPSIAGLDCVYQALRDMGWTRIRTVEQMHRYWRSNGGTDTKHVEVWTDGDRRVDLICFGVPA